MRRTFYQKHKKGFDHIDGFLLENPVLELGLVLAPVIVASYNCLNSLILGMSFILITFFTVLLSSFISKKIPYTIRVILYALIACLVFIPTAMLMDYLYPKTIFKIGVYLPLLVANSLIVAKSESRFHQHKRSFMIIDLLCHTIGFFWVIMLVGILRELFGSGTVFGTPVDVPFTAPAILMPFSGFILVGFLAAIVKHIKYSVENPRSQRVNPEQTAEVSTRGGLLR